MIEFIDIQEAILMVENNLWGMWAVFILYKSSTAYNFFKMQDSL